MQQLIKHIIEVVGMDNATQYINSLLISERDKNRIYNQLHNSTGSNFEIFGEHTGKILDSIPITTNEFQASDFD